LKFSDAEVMCARMIFERALDATGRRTVLDLLASPRFRDGAPLPIWSALLDDDRYYCSVSKLYRILRGDQKSLKRVASSLT
jgi:hypothetical protein